MEDLEIVLNLSGDVPIYEQIETQIRDQILSGRLKAGQSIPSMRALAKLLHVSVITVQKAYENLRHDGFIESMVGRGTVVAAVSYERQLEEKRRELEHCLEQAVALAKICSLDVQELKNLLDLFYEESETV